MGKQVVAGLRCSDHDGAVRPRMEGYMKTWKLLLSLLVALSLIATACGGSDGDDDAADAGDTTTEVEASDDGDAMDEDEGEDHSDDDAMEEEEAMDDDAMDDEGDTAMAESSAGAGGPLSLLQWQAPSQANAHLSNGTKDLLASSLVLEALASIAPDGSVVPRLAESIPTVSNGGISEDLTEITWTLQEGITWSDGSPLTSADVLFTYEYCADELTGCTGDWNVDIETVEAIDERTIKITWNKPLPYPYTAFVGYSSPVLQEAQFRDCVGEGSAACSDENFAPVGTGPYMIVELRPEDTVSYVMNPNYRGAADGQPYFSDVTIKGGGEAEAAARSVLEIGEADYAWNLQVAPEILGPMEAAGQGRVAVAFTTSVEHINLNQTNNRLEGDDRSNYLDGTNPHPILFQNADLARALSLAIDRDLLVQVGYGANGSPTCNIWNVGNGIATSLDWCKTRDVDQANQILDDAGYVDTDGDGIRETPDGLALEFDYATSTNAVRQSNQEVIKDNWSDIGVAVNMKNEDASLFFDGTNAQGLSIWHFFNDMEMFTNGAANPDPASYLSGWITDEIPTLETAWGGGNMPRLSDAEYDATYEELAATALDDPNRDTLTQRLNEILVEKGAIIPLILRGSVSAFSSDIENTGPLNGWDSEYWNIAEWTRAG